MCDLPLGVLVSVCKAGVHAVVVADVSRMLVQHSGGVYVMKAGLDLLVMSSLKQTVKTTETMIQVCTQINRSLWTISVDFYNFCFIIIIYLSHNRILSSWKNAAYKNTRNKLCGTRYLPHSRVHNE